MNAKLIAQLEILKSQAETLGMTEASAYLGKAVREAKGEKGPAGPGQTSLRG